MGKFKVGDTVEVVGNKSSHGFDLGTHVTILRHDIHDGDYECHDGLGKSWYLIYPDMAPVGPTLETKEANDGYNIVSKPSHYNQAGIEAIDAIRAALGPEGFQSYCNGNTLKYLWRWKYKGGLEDLKKAQVYLNWMVESKEINNED